MAATRTVRDLVTRALRVAGVVGAGETANADDSADALLSLNMMLDAWQADRLFAYSIAERTHALTSGVGSYSIGIGATINVPRPVRIEYAFTRDSQNYDRQIQVIDDAAFSEISLKSLGETYPTVLQYDATYPTGTITLWPVPQSGLTLHIGAWEVLSEYASLNTVVSLPPGYEDAIVFSLVERLNPEYGRQSSADVIAIARKARAAIQQNNLPELSVSCEFMGSGRQSYLPYHVVVSGSY